MNKKTKIQFIAPNSHVMQVREKPKPASEFVPEWWKKMSPHIDGGKFNLTPMPNATAKKCFPLLDAITSGYIVTLWADILVTQEKEGPYIKWATQSPVVDVWSSKQSNGYDIPDEYSKTVFKYLHGWVIKTPKNYSSFITHPVGYQNLPFRTLTGVVDTDSLETFANSPFTIKKDFEGIIEKGTPMFQIIPFKRESWESEYIQMHPEEDDINHEKLHSTIISSYGRLLRKNKSYK